MRIIWVDDDSYGILSVLVLRLKRKGFSVEKFKFFEDAEKFIEEDLRLTDAFLIDFILPCKEVKVSPFLGLNIAEAALKAGVKNITFLSVVALNQVKKDLEDIKMSYPHFNYEYLNKADLVESENFDQLVKFLQKIS